MYSRHRILDDVSCRSEIGTDSILGIVYISQVELFEALHTSEIKKRCKKVVQT